MNAARHNGYKTVENAEKKLLNVVGDIKQINYVIAVNDAGRFVPCVVGRENFDLVHRGITVLG